MHAICGALPRFPATRTDGENFPVLGAPEKSLDYEVQGMMVACVQVALFT